jgi:pimeloyl-ACP methyl ester carboxylesterase
MFIGIGGRQVFMVDLGAGGLPFVAHSGWVGTWEDWEPPLAALSRTRRAVGFDHRGAGRTGGEPEHISFSALVDDLVALLDGLGITRCALGGFSNGNRVVQEAVARQPDRYAGLVLMCPSETPEANEGSSCWTWPGSPYGNLSRRLRNWRSIAIRKRWPA